MSEQMVPLESWHESSAPPLALLPYWKKEITGYYPPDPSLMREVPDGLNDEALERSLRSLRDYLSLPILEDIWMKDPKRDRIRQLFRLQIEPEAREAFQRNKLRINPNTGVLLIIPIVAEYLDDAQKMKVLAINKVFFKQFKELWGDFNTPDTQKVRVTDEFSKFTASVFDDVVKARLAAQTKPSM